MAGESVLDGMASLQKRLVRRAKTLSLDGRGGLTRLGVPR
jgi:hypothetical protein